MIGICAAAVVLAVALCAWLLPKQEEELSAISVAASAQAVETSYQAYLDEKGYAEQMAAGQAEVDVFAWTEDGSAAA